MVALLSRVLSVLMFIHAYDCDYIPKWSCDFENGLCHWLQAIDDQKDFKHVSGHETEWNDHTTKSQDGKFLYLHFGSHYPREEVTAKLMSPILMPNNGSCKMILHYKTYRYLPNDKVQVYVNMISKGSSGRIHHKPLFQSYINSVWAKLDVILQSNVEFQVEIVGVIKAYFFGKIGIDDIWFNAGCQTNEKSPIRLIKLQSSPSHNYPAGVFYENLNGSWSAICSVDRAHSACNLLGLTDVKVGNYTSLHGQLQSGQRICLPKNITVPTSKLCNNESSCRNVTYWECKQEYISICPKMTHLACTSAVKNPVCVSRNQICDFNRDCPGGEDESDCLAYNRCDFQKGMCDWVAAKHSFFEWERYYDHVLRKFCVNVNSSHGHTMDRTAQLRLKYLVEGKRNGTCSVRFMYRTRGLLRMVLKEKTRNETVWSVTSALGQWRRAFVQLPDNRSFQVFFEAIITDRISVVEHFGLADISFSKECNFSNHTHGYLRNDSSIFVCSSGEAVEKNFVCDFKVDCFDGSDESNCSHVTDRCDFDSSFCDWQTELTAPEWLRRLKGRTPSFNTGPSKDHTNKYKSGYYVYLEATGVASGDYGRLISRIMQRSSTNKCTFRWFYHMWSIYDYVMGKLSIIYRDVETQSERILWQVQGNQGNVWKYGSVTFDITSFQYKIIIKAVRGASYTSDIAVDDVSFAPECLQTEDFEAITITKYPNCTSVKYILNGKSASLYQFGSGRVLCDVTIRTDPRLRIRLYAEFFNTDSSKVVVIDAGRNGSVIYGGNFSGSLRPFSLISSTNIITIRVPPVDGFGSHSFAFNITDTDILGHPPVYYRPSGSTRMKVIRDCGGYVSWFRFTSSGTVKPRLSTYGNYYDNERCIFKFMVSNGYRIRFTFNMFETEARYDYVQILNNGIIGQSRFTGSHNVIQFISKRSYVEMLFVSDYSNTRRGFSLSVMTTDDKASAAKFTLPTTIPPWFTTTPYQPLPYTSHPWFPSVFLNEKCPYQSTSPQFATGDYQFGKIYFDNRRRSLNMYQYLHCSWKSYQSYGKYLLEFTHIDTGSWYNVLTVNYETGKSKEFRGHVNVKDLDIFEADSQFTITVRQGISSTVYTVQFQMGYSRNPGCYAIGLASYYTYRYKAYSECYCEGFKYGFLASNGSCYCGNRPPAYYGFFMQNTSYCSSCFGSCGFGKLFIHISRYNARLSNQDSQDDKRKTATTAIVSTVSLLASMIIGYVAYTYYKRKCRISTRRSATARDQGGNQRNLDPCAYFINAHSIEGMLPSYEDATKDRVFFVNTLQDGQNLQYRIGEAPPSFDDALNDLASDRPPQYTEISVTSNQIEGTEGVPGHIDDYSDLMVALPGVESADRPLSREGRRNSEREGHGEARTNEVRHERTSEEDERPHEDRTRSEESRGLSYGIAVCLRRNHNRTTDLPPMQRVRAYDNRGVDST